MINKFRALIGAALFAIATLWLSGCLVSGSESKAEPAAKLKGSTKKIPVAIFDPVYVDDKVFFSAVSSGCTSSDSFILESAAKQADGICALTIYRVKPDRCKKRTSLMRFEISWQAPSQCSKTEVSVSNPIISDELLRQLR